VVVSAFGFIAVLVPLIEELLKPLAVWLFASTLDSPAQGFLFGALSGAAFALFESLNASADASTTWAVIIGGRIGTGILHITASAFVGLGIGYAFKEKRYGLLLACYGAAVFAHSLWNASALGLAFTGLSQLTGNAEWLVLSPFLLCNLLALGMIFLAVLVASNKKLQNAAPAPVEVEAVTEQQPNNN
jgi:RsiW-degrading membrane proteinase PrsW (M82 family)